MVFDPGSLIVVREVWDGLLWAARPAIVVSDDGHDLVHWCPAGVVGCFATSRSFPGREHLPPEERQLVSLESREWHYRGVPGRGTKLSFVRAGEWASVEATWYPDGRFAHWYVNLQLPLERTAKGYETLDLVLDMIVAPDWSWAWKDVEPFKAALGRGIFEPEVEASVESQTAELVQEIESRSGRFSPEWREWVAPVDWPVPSLPEDFAAGVATPAGSTITLSPDPIV